MEIKLFGKSLFSVGKSRVHWLLNEASDSEKQSKFLPDFYRSGNDTGTLVRFEDMSITSSAATALSGAKVIKAAKENPKPAVKKLTPKDVYELKMLNEKTFELKTDPKYVDGQIADFKTKLELIKTEEYDMRRGVEEISSILVRMENRKKYPEVKDFFEQFPYTTTAKIADLVKAHDYLQLGQVAQFLAEMPKEAVKTMEDYNDHTKKVSGKRAVFYIVADKKDFQKNNVRRDPILLAQSPFGHFWQILGAWDKEMLFVEEL